MADDISQPVFTPLEELLGFGVVLAATAETYVGSSGNDFKDLEGGADFAEGREGNDTLLGGEGNDTLFGESGADSLQGGNG